MSIKIGNRISCSSSLYENVGNLFNSKNMSVLDNYAKAKKLSIKFASLESDIFDNTVMTVSRPNSDVSKEYTLKLSAETKEAYVNSMKKIYETVAEAKVSLAKATHKKFAEIAKYYIETQKI